MLGRGQLRSELLCTLPGTGIHPDSGGTCTDGVAGLHNHPINCVEWEQARTYCLWLNGELPTEAQWQYAARGDELQTWPWGELYPSYDNPDLANCNQYYCYDEYPETAPVNAFPNGISPFGLYNLAGYVGEWVFDWYFEYFPIFPETYPTGPVSGTARVLRGGSYRSNYNYPNSLSVIARSEDTPTDRNDDDGFRCAAPALP
ncbi:MAG: hypothetical protein A2284_15470 [Deltaproteobacteria bacterium RIFOXYA12_FULL_61_11]|nr:MAG: hypothetical protein A2284_15470 [Deltaproteobacteria bacterium RIFOXYA12_FULL_61_11]